MIVAALSVGLAAEHGLVRGLLCRGVELREPASHPLALVGELVGIVCDELGGIPRAGDRKHGTRAGWSGGLDLIPDHHAQASPT